MSVSELSCRESYLTCTNRCMFSSLTYLFSRRGGWRCILPTVLTNCVLKPWRMVFNCSDIMARLQLCLPGALARRSVDVYDTLVIDTGSCLGSKEQLELLNRSPPSPRVIAMAYSISIVSHSVSVTSYLQTKWPVGTLKGKLRAFLHNRKRYLNMLSK